MPWVEPFPEPFLSHDAHAARPDHSVAVAARRPPVRGPPLEVRVTVLVVDVGGTNLRLLSTGRRTPRKAPSGDDLTPARMVAETLAAVADWSFDRVSVGFPGPVRDQGPIREPGNLGTGWMRLLGLGTGLGTTIIIDGTVVRGRYRVWQESGTWV